MRKKGSSTRWLQEHFQDPYVLKAREQKYRSRAAFKLQEINAKENLLRSGMIVVDLGAAPGSWSQVASDHIGQAGQVIALDILPMPPLSRVNFIQGDFREEETLNKLKSTLRDHSVDIVLSDMAPNMSGIIAADQPRSVYLGELALDFALNYLKLGGSLLMKSFQGAGFQIFYNSIHEYFYQTRIIKPMASRDCSREIYILARKLKKSK
ncbi:RlmE family RNA methyltransferase [Candidatus Nitrosacidococcus sp. I8]|uniref:RlmE family RNA methyltransferase n=1 Tax=Candidatus Nitrosacidococcus sp. I8 TaxID=2942908 RepID=UPI002225E3CE|nr:SAM-dependent methyltransferase [Candidatus Nitrosacidococcus sp. I8]CAH9016347.1 Ribosomal RNA large subunit methyltransferase E [Candidatus Nitrosacidococcus sp. I8]